MIKSMTGYGKAETRTKYGLFAAEIKTFNHKFLEINAKLPNSLAVFEDRVKGLVKHRLKRGKVYCNLIHDTTGATCSSIVIDERLARSYSKKLKKLAKELGLKDSVCIADIIAFPGVVSFKTMPRDATKIWTVIKDLISKTLDELADDREKEGAFLYKDISSRIKAIKGIVADIKKSSRYNVSDYKRRLSQRIKELSGSQPMDRGRLELEVALFAKNSDITEELTRLDNHIRNFLRTIRRKGEVGKKLDFIAQELHREANTIGSKSSGFNISESVIEIKTGIEKIREQLKNIE